MAAIPSCVEMEAAMTETDLLTNRCNRRTSKGHEKKETGKGKKREREREIERERKGELSPIGRHIAYQCTTLGR